MLETLHVLQDVCFLQAKKRGVSLVELLIVIGVIAIFSAITIPLFINVMTSSAHRTADRNLKYLNGAVLGFNQANWELVLSPASDSSDELKVFQSLVYRDSANPAPGSPYLPVNAIFTASGSPDTYRATWNGRMFELLAPGTNGVGMDLMKLMGDSAQPASTNTPIPPA